MLKGTTRLLKLPILLSMLLLFSVTSSSFAQGGPIVVNHASVALFDQIPEEFKVAAQNLRMMWADRSVGYNTSEGLDCLTQQYATATASCKAASTETWTGTYPRTNWQFWGWPGQTQPNGQPFPNAITCTGYNGQWAGYQPCFFSFVTPRLGDWDVLSFQFDYLMALTGSNLPNYLTNLTGNHDVFDFAAFEQANPSKKFIYWTTSLARSIGTSQSENFNNGLRQYAQANGNILFDFADIEAHRPDGTECRNAAGYQIICETYTTESNGGHLGSMATGKIRVAKAFWVLMAQLAGWNPNAPPPPPPPSEPLLLTCNASILSCSIGGVSIGETVTVRVTRGNGDYAETVLTRPTAGVTSPEPNVLPLFINASLTLSSPMLPGVLFRQASNITLPADLAALTAYPDCKPEENCMAGLRVCQPNTTSTCATFYAGMPFVDLYLTRKIGTRAAQHTKIGTAIVELPAIVGPILPKQ